MRKDSIFSFCLRSLSEKGNLCIVPETTVVFYDRILAVRFRRRAGLSDAFPRAVYFIKIFML